jgi:hypothetical protein
MNCVNKNYRDTANNAFPLVEDRLRLKLGVDRGRSGNDLVDYAFNTTSGKLLVGNSSSEQEGVLLLFKGVFPPAHTLGIEEGRDAAQSLKIIEKARLR